MDPTTSRRYTPRRVVLYNRINVRYSNVYKSRTANNHNMLSFKQLRVRNNNRLYV